MDVNKENLKQGILNVDKGIISTAFITRAVVYSGILDPLEGQNSDELLKWLHNFSKLIESNYETHVLSREIKNNLYRILFIFRNNFSDGEVLEQINRSILLLNNSTEENYVQMVTDEFNNRVLCTMPIRKLILFKSNNFEELEKIVKISICKDHNFFVRLTKESEKEFLDANVGSDWAPTNISNLLINYSEVLREPELMNRIMKLLNYNLSLPKTGAPIFGSLQDRSKVCLKRLKRLK